jgi:hypothetical protein
MGTFGDSWLLTKTAFRMIREDRSLFWIPLFACLALLGILALAIVPIFAYLVLVPGAWSALFGSKVGLALFALLWIGLYFVLVFVGTYFTAALVGAATIKLQGGNPTVADGLAVARSKLRRLLLWSLFAASVGLLIQLISSRFKGIVGTVLRIAAGVSWGVATYFVVPVLLYESEGTISSLVRSAKLFFRTFGRTVVTNLVLGLIGAGIFLLGVALAVGGLFLFGPAGGVVGVVLLALGVIVIVFDAVLMTAVGGVLRAALYRYATTGQIAAGLVPPQYLTPSALPPSGAPLPTGQPLP